MTYEYSKNAAAWQPRRKYSFLFLIAALLIIASSGAHAAEASLPIRASIIGYEDVKRMCGSEAPPTWCPARLLRQNSQNTADKAGNQGDKLVNVAGMSRTTVNLE